MNAVLEEKVLPIKSGIKFPPFLNTKIENPQIKDFNINPVFSESDLVKIYNLSYVCSYFQELSLKNCITKLFKLKLDKVTVDTIDITIKGRQIVSLKNNLPDFMARKNQASIDVKSVGSEVPFSYLLRSMNGGNKCKLKTPELNTITPNKDKPDYELCNKNHNLLFDMKSQCKSKTININKLAHDRAVEQGLTFYIVGVVDEDTIEQIKEVTYYLLPLGYFLSHCKFINNTPYCLQNHRNDYYAVELKSFENSIFITNKSLQSI